MSDWIKCSERMPEKPGEYFVLVQHKYGELTPERSYMGPGKDTYRNMPIVAWMEIPPFNKPKEQP